MRQSDSVSEELDTENVQCALDFENTMNELETQLYYRHLPPKEVALRVMEAACKFYDADWCGLIQVDLDLGLWKPLWWHNECQEDKTTILTNEFESSEFLDRWVKAVRRGTPMVVSDAEDPHNADAHCYILRQQHSLYLLRKAPQADQLHRADGIYRPHSG